MNKQEFVTVLRQNLSGMEDYEFVNDTVNYYEDYIETRVRKGEAESKILEELGEPRLIAKSIKASKSEIVKAAEQSVETEGTTKAPFAMKFLSGFMQLPSWLMKLIVVASTVAIIILLALLIQWLFPVIVVGAIALILYRFVKNNFR